MQIIYYFNTQKKKNTLTHILVGALRQMFICLNAPTRMCVSVFFFFFFFFFFFIKKRERYQFVLKSKRQNDWKQRTHYGLENMSLGFIETLHK